MYIIEKPGVARIKLDDQHYDLVVRALEGEVRRVEHMRLKFMTDDAKVEEITEVTNKIKALASEPDVDFDKLHADVTALEDDEELEYPYTGHIISRGTAAGKDGWSVTDNGDRYNYIDLDEALDHLVYGF